MSVSICRLGNIGQGYCSACKKFVSGRVTEASTDVLVGGVGIARDGDTVTAVCGHTGSIRATSMTVKVNGKSVARIGDTFDGVFTGRLTEGVDTVTAG